MKSQLLQSCRGCVPSTTGPILTFPKGKEKSPNEGPIPAFPKGKVCTTTSSNTTRMNSRPLGRVREGLTISCFFTANGGLFERPKAAFFTVAAVVAMQGMALGMVATTRRKTCFPTDVVDITKRQSRQQPPWLFVFQPRNNWQKRAVCQIIWLSLQKIGGTSAI